jgi:aminopeptidase-like protein
VESLKWDFSMDPLQIGERIYALVQELYPICRSMTGDGLRRTMEILQGYVPLEVHEVPSGTRVFDWTVPKEWNIRGAYVKDSGGNRVVDFRKSNLHVVGYSTPIHEVMSLENLKPHLFSLPGRPGWIPYRTSYYEEGWGFCLSHDDYLRLADGDYEVVIDSTLDDGSLTYGELYLPGSEETEVLVSCHACHPSLCNDNLSGISIGTLLAREIAMVPRRYSYRFVFAPATIGAITWLALNEEKVSNIGHGLVLAGLGDAGGVTYKRSRSGDAEIDRAVCQVLRHSGSTHRIIDFEPYGYDERQYCSPGFDLPVGSISRTPYGAYPEYHTSGDNLDFIRPEHLGDSFNKIRQVFEVLETNRTYVNLNPKCEPQLGKRGLYKSIGESERALLWTLSLSDGRHNLLDIANRSDMPFPLLREAAKRLADAGLLEPVPTRSAD